MGTYTKNYNMYKPAKTDYYNVETDQNDNFDILDTELKKTNDSNKDLFEMIQGNSGIKFDKNLIFLNDKGEKKKGNVYLDRLQNGMFECIQTTSTTVNNSSYFKNFSNNELSNRLDNLITINGNDPSLQGQIKTSNLYIFTYFVQLVEGQGKKIFEIPQSYKLISAILEVTRNKGGENVIATLNYPVGNTIVLSYQNSNGQGNAYKITAFAIKN